MVNVGELRGLLPPQLRTVPLVAYFHENQLFYPVRKEDERNQHFSLINWVSALCADESWFNSSYNATTLLQGLENLLRKMPDEPSLETLDRIRERSRVEPPLIAVTESPQKRPGPLHIAWVGRWEHDKRPDAFFAALRKLRDEGTEFRLSCFGQSFRQWPADFASARGEFGDTLEHFGFVESRAEYELALGRCDVAVSTAEHEFFGVALLEAVALGCLPLVPNRLVYPEIYPGAALYDGKIKSLVAQLRYLAKLKATQGTLVNEYARHDLSALVRKYDAQNRADAMDLRLVEIVTASRD
jgi:glycosyltransferase involved in cell wall biosynthesis